MIDRIRLAEMTKMNFTQKEMADRLGCSERQIRRIVKELDIDSSTTCLKERGTSLRVTKESEECLREFFCQFESGERTAERFGISRQAILKGN